MEEIEVEEILNKSINTPPPAEVKKIPDDSLKWGSSLNCTFPGKHPSYLLPSSGNFLAVARAMTYKLEDDEYMWEKVGSC